jgi:hypothetical protein
VSRKWCQVQQKWRDAENAIVASVILQGTPPSKNVEQLIQQYVDCYMKDLFVEKMSNLTLSS